MTRPALRPLAVTTVVLVAGAVGAVPATAAGAPPAPPAAAHLTAAHTLPAFITPAATPAAVHATMARGPGAPQTGLVASSAVVAGGGIEGSAPPGEHGAAGRASGAPGRARAPPQ
jgi:hypothetical protein